MIKAIFLDVDGTLISFKTHRVPASALDALREAHARGVQLFIATGRAAADLADLEAIPYDGVAALNGADCLMRAGRVVARHPIPRADFEKSLALSAELDFPVGLELNDGVFVICWKDWSKFTSTVVFPICPRFVLIEITPFAP